MKHLDYVFKLTKFAFRENPLLYLSITISLFSVVVELLAMSSLLPLFDLVSGKSVGDDSGIIPSMLSRSGFDVTSEALLWTFIALFTLRIVTLLMGQSLSMYLTKLVQAQLCSGVFNRIVHNLSLRDINEKNIGFYISMAGDESARASSLVMSLIQFVSVAALALFYFAIIAKQSPSTAIFIIVFMLCALLAMYKVLKASHRMGERAIVGSRETGSLFLNVLNNIKVIRAFSAEKYVVEMHRYMMFSYSKILFWVEEISLLTRIVPILFMLIAFAGWLAFSAKTMEDIGLAFIVTIIIYLMRFFPAVGQGVMLLLKIASDTKSGKDVTALLDMPTGSQSTSSYLPDEIKEIVLQNVSFYYDDVAKKEILKGVNLKFDQGKSYALVGKSGVGKSTLVDLLLKFYLPTSGYFQLNGRPMLEVTNSVIRKKVILVSQDMAIFDDTAINNVRLGMNAPLNEVISACVAAEIHEVIENMPESYETRLQYQGKNLSGGQRQRIAIARGLLRNPDVLIFDESTNALDKITQKKVVENILREMAGKIVIFVTHDPQIMEQVDEIVDLEKINNLALSASVSDTITD